MSKSQDNINSDLKEVGFVGVSLIPLVYDKVQRRDFVKTVIKSQRTGNVLTI
jgi:hypothetical protein